MQLLKEMLLLELDARHQVRRARLRSKTLLRCNRRPAGDDIN
jgi:hypothetical protein